jgi:pyruvate/2-oxoglutarate/acetoin dehydrogenase E1 component
MRELTYIRAIQEALFEEMRRDEKVFLLGESVRGGNYEHTVGLVGEFGPHRVLDTPICETAISGAGIGSALAGYRPVVELMFADFMYVAADEVFLKAAQWRFMHGGQTTMPVVFMMAAGGGLMLSNEHSRIPSALILHHPGLKLVVPSDPYDAKGLLKTAIRDDNPVVYFWHKAIMGMKGEVPEEEYTIPFGQAAVKRQGDDVTVVAVSNMVNFAMDVARELATEGISVEVIDPRTLEPLDLGTVLHSVEKTNRLVIVDEDTERCGFAAELGLQIVEHGFDLLDTPIQRVCAANYPIAGGFMEQHVLPSRARLKAAIQGAVA